MSCVRSIKRKNKEIMSGNKRKVGELDVDRQGSSLWLVKVPAFVATTWADHASNGDIVGSLSIQAVQQPGMNAGKPVKQISVKLNDIRSQAVSKGGSSSRYIEDESKITDSNSNIGDEVFVSEYTLDKLNQNATKTQMVAFSMDPKDHAYDVVGQITDQLILKPKGTAYRQVIRERKMNIENNKRGTVKGDTNMVLDATKPFTLTGDSITAPSQELVKLKKKSASDGECDVSEVKSSIFKHFENSEFIELKVCNMLCRDIIGVTERHIKDVLSMYCMYNNKGDNRGKYELKREYKKYG